MKQGLLLINLGTPDTPKIKDVRRYLKQFLSDPRVIDLPPIIRYTLLYGFILPFRPKQSSRAYQSIWDETHGSPLLFHSQQLKRGMQKILPSHYRVALGMRYGTPSIADALTELSDCHSITVMPLFPQYSSAATGSAIEAVLSELKNLTNIPSLTIIRDFHDHPGFINPMANLIQPQVSNHEHILFSYHGLPERQIQKGGCQTVCQTTCPLPTQAQIPCYRAQCYATSRALAAQLKLTESLYTTSFQSRLGRTPWIQPYTDETLTKLAQKGIKKLLIACPSFTADCLETLEEIGMQGQEQWHALGGDTLTLVPCVNANDSWMEGLKTIAFANISV